MKNLPYTNIVNEIESEGEPVGFFFYAIMVFIGTAVTLAVLDAIFGMERVTDVIAIFF